MSKMSKDISHISYVGLKRVARARSRMYNDQTATELVETFKVLSEPTRVRILHALADDDLCVGDISAVIQITPSAIFHQLRILRTARLVRSRKVGKMVYYSLDDEHVRNLFEEGIRHLEEG